MFPASMRVIVKTECRNLIIPKHNGTVTSSVDVAVFKISLKNSFELLSLMSHQPS